MILSARIGAVEFVGDEVRLAIIKTNGKRPKVLELHRTKAEYTEPEQRTEALTQAVHDIMAQIKNKPVVYTLCMSSRHGVVRTLTIPFRGQRKVASAIPFELERYLAFPIEELVVDYVPVMEIEGQTEVLAFGMRRDTIREQLDILQAAGIDPESINIDCLGLTNLWRSCLPTLKGLHAIFHARETGSVLAIINGKTPVYLRNIAYTAEQIQNQPGLAVQEIHNSLRAFQANWRGNNEVASLTITGLGLLEDARTEFSKTFDLPIAYENLGSRLTLLSQAAASGALPCQANTWEAIIGTAGTAVGTPFSLNFRKDELSLKSTTSGLIPHLMMTVCLILMLFVGLLWHYREGRIRYEHESVALEEQIASLEKEVETLQAQGINVGGDIFSEPSLLDILNEISLRLPDDKGSITQLRVEPSGSTAPWIILEGDVKDDTSFAAAFTELKKSTLFKVDEDPGLELQKGKSTFKIVARRLSSGETSTTAPATSKPAQGGQQQ